MKRIGLTVLLCAGAAWSKTPDVDGQPSVVGDVDKDLIRRIIKRHGNDVRACYADGLDKTPSLQGKVVVQFTIAPLGNVSSAKIQSSTLNAPTVEKCITDKVQEWRFPGPQSGSVTVTYPFTFVRG
jgi:TonB family protein